MMARDDVFIKLDEIFQDVFDDATIHVTEETTSDDIEDWDSFEHIMLVVAIEQKFKIKFNIGEVNMLRNVGEMVDVILAKE